PDHPQRGGLAAAGRTQHAEELTGVDVEREIVDGDRLAEVLGDPIQANVDFLHVIPLAAARHDSPAACARLSPNEARGSRPPWAESSTPLVRSGQATGCRAARECLPGETLAPPSRPSGGALD